MDITRTDPVHAGSDSTAGGRVSSGRGTDRESGPDHGYGPAAGFRGLPPGVRLWFPVILSFLVQVPPTLFILFRTGPYNPVEILVAAALAVATPLLLIGARRFPGPVVACVTVVALADLLLVPYFGPPTIALGFAILSGIFRGARIWVYASVVSGWLVAVFAGSMLGMDWHPVRIAFVTAGLAFLLALAEGARSRRQHLQEARQRSLQHRATVEQAERMRIARELHDVLAHSLSQIYVQAGMGLHLMDTQPEKTRESLANIKTSSKTALDEVRGVLAFLRLDTDAASRVPEPDLSALPKLLDSFRAQGIDVAFDSSVSELPSARVQLALYRIVQESLTNVLRHANASKAAVVLEDVSDSIRLRVTDNGTGMQSTAHAQVNGSGLLGMAERATLLGGTFELGDSPTGGFAVTVVVPREQP
ncbi:sensor histidine kinase [Mycetocola zhadangensis]|uniref:histidine kinase n=1 Tax=Mycetocola zhadangensis TaxID=1164595 RepID=A0A3L7IT52_9MICO|nr:sensor histidine kinase [Mycetocola zhadangensis]RLQ81387.1 sensor histidine kinase [Mycetocola zhadangensis]GGF02148.1 two-component sensor histidine kinase [Mycetocola zhadangensis]